jgi:hypothetical protein
MGVEYRHFLVVNDPNWRPENDTALRIDDILRQWLLADRLRRIVDLSTGNDMERVGSNGLVDPGRGLAFRYAGVDGSAVARIAGPSLYDADPDHRYTMSTWLVLGSDYRVHYSSEAFFFDLISPPTTGGRPIEPDERESLDILFDQSFPADDATSPPVVKIHVEDHAKPHLAWSQYQGFWRGALVIDFGKDLPHFVDGVHQLPARDFIAAIGEAFRGPIVEVGEFY